MVKKIQKIVTIIQARMASTRLPGKVMMKVLDKPLLSLMLERVQKSSLAGTIIVATTSHPADDIIADLCSKETINCFRGHPFDLLQRHYKAALEYNADIILKIPSDCPLIDPKIIDKVIEEFIKHNGKHDYMSNLHPATYPDGNDVEVFTFSALHKAFKESFKDYEREHTTPFIWNNPGKFSIGNYEWQSGLNYSYSHRFVLDYREDFEFIKRVFNELYPSNPNFEMQDILRLLELKPEIKSINIYRRGINWYKNYINEFKDNELKPKKIAV